MSPASRKGHERRRRRRRRRNPKGPLAPNVIATIALEGWCGVARMAVFARHIYLRSACGRRGQETIGAHPIPAGPNAAVHARLGFPRKRRNERSRSWRRRWRGCGRASIEQPFVADGAAREASSPAGELFYATSARILPSRASSAETGPTMKRRRRKFSRARALLDSLSYRDSRRAGSDSEASSENPVLSK